MFFYSLSIYYCKFDRHLEHKENYKVDFLFICLICYCKFDKYLNQKLRLKFFILSIFCLYIFNINYWQKIKIKEIENFVFVPSIYIPLNKNKSQKIIGTKLSLILLTLFSFIDFTWLLSILLILLTSILLILSIFYIFMKISQTISTIIKNISVVNKTRQRNFTNIISSYSMQSSLNYFHLTSY